MSALSQSRFEIQVFINATQSYMIDTNGVESLPFTFNIAAIQDVSKKDSSYSKTIKIPESAHNREVFGFISNLANDNTFDVNKKAKCYVLVDSIPVIDGFIQMTRINVYMDKNYVEYECAIIADNGNFYTSIGDGFISDYDYSEFNHNWNGQNIFNSWTQSWNHGYYYPLIDYGYNLTNNNRIFQGTFSNSIFDRGLTIDLSVAQIFPATYAKIIWNKIFADIGYTYQSNFLDSDVFENLLIPFNGDLIQSPTSSNTTPTNFYVGLTNLKTIFSTVPGGKSQTFTYSLVMDNSSTPFYDPDGYWTTPGDNQYHNVSTHSYNQNFTINLRNYWRVTDGDEGDIIRYAYLTMYRSQDVHGATLSTWNSGTGDPMPIYNGGGTIYLDSSSGDIYFEAPGVGTYSNYTLTQVNFTTDNFDGHDNFHRPLLPGERFRIVLSVRYRNYDPDITSTEDIIANGSDTSVFNTLSNQAGQGSSISYNSVIPKKVKKKDFFNSIVKMFNLYIEPSKTNPKNLLIEPRNAYYQSGVIKDWSEKLDENSPIEEDILSNTQNKRVILSYKDDGDFYNKNYKDSFDQTYGEFIYTNDNQFLNDDNTISVNFSPTPLVGIPSNQTTPTSFIIPSIVKKDDADVNAIFQKTTSNIRIVTKCTSGNYSKSGLVDIFNDVTEQYNGKWRFITLDLGTLNLTYYPYVGNLDDPYFPNYDINFGQTLRVYYDPNQLTFHNLYSDYYKRMLDEINDKNSRLVTCNLYLTPQDIYNFRFSDSIFLIIDGVGEYYRVNRIIDYDPSTIESINVELIKVTPLNVFIDNPLNINSLIPVRSKEYSLNILNLGVQNVLNVNKILNLGDRSVISGTNVISSGNANVIQSLLTLSMGDNNTILNSSRTSLIVGDGNIFDNSVPNSVSLGNRNYIGLNSNSVFVFGDNIAIQNSNIFNVNARFSNTFNAASAGVDEVLSPYSDNIINIMSAGVDEVRSPYSDSVINVVSAGVDDVFMDLPYINSEVLTLLR